MITQELVDRLHKFDLKAIDEAAENEQVSFDDVINTIYNRDSSWRDWQPNEILGEHELIKLAITKAQLTDNFKSVDSQNRTIIFGSSQMERLGDRINDLITRSSLFVPNELSQTLQTETPFRNCRTRSGEEGKSFCPMPDNEGFTKANNVLQKLHNTINESADAIVEGNCRIIDPSNRERSLCKLANEDPYSLTPRVFVQKVHSEMSQRSGGHAIKVIHNGNKSEINLLNDNDTRIGHFMRVARSIGGACRDRDRTAMGRSVVCAFEDVDKEKVNNLAYMLNYYDSLDDTPAESAQAELLFKALSPTQQNKTLSNSSIMKASRRIAETKNPPEVKSQAYKVLLSQAQIGSVI